jgi:hypothetical protein
MKATYVRWIILACLLATLTSPAQTNRVVFLGGATSRASMAAAGTPLQGVSSNATQTSTTFRLENQVLPVAPGNLAVAAASRRMVPMDSLPGCIQPPAGLVGWWPGEGDASDIAGGNPGTLQNGAGFDSGQVGQAFAFSGDSQAVEIPYAPAFVSSSYSVEAWVEPLAKPDWQALIFGQSYGRQLIVRPGDTGLAVAFAFSTDPCTFYEVDAPDEIPIGVFTHLVGTWDAAAGTLSLYVNGDLVAQSPVDATSWDSGCVYHIGGFYDPDGGCAYAGQFFKGFIDEVSYYARAVSSDEVQALASAGCAGKCWTVPPWILTQPQGQRIPVGANVDFSVSVAGTPPLYYQWRLDATPLAGATTSALALAGVQIPDSGSYSVVVTSGNGSATSSDAILTVYDPVCVQPPAGLVSWWAAEGSAFDALCANNGTLQGGVDFAPGQVGQAFNFDGQNGTVVVPDSSSLRLTNQLTIEAWINPRSVSGDQSIVGKVGFATGNHGYEFVLSDSTLLGLLNGPDQDWPWGSVQSDPLIAAGLWYHVAFTYDQSAMKLYVNGLPVAANVVGPQAIAATGTDLRISGADDHIYFNGLIDETSLYNRALSDAEIQSIYNAGVAGKWNIPAAWLVQYFGANYQNNPNASVTADPDHDGLSNALEYLQGRNPVVAGTIPDTGGQVNLQVYTPLK